ncbi:MAG: hypothetical protein HQK81_13025, partial [Desulfovibrionaceae bacterium]|nr:hypothetical protein [Desulfovibrionaceae bacterium]
MTPRFSVIALSGGDSSRLGALIDHVRIVGYGKAVEIIVCGEASPDSPDSSDSTGPAAYAAGRPGVRLATAAGGRAAKYNAGAALAFGDVVMFIEAGTRLPARAFDLAADCLTDGRAGGGAFGVEAACAGLAA